MAMNDVPLMVGSPANVEVLGWMTMLLILLVVCSGKVV